MIVPMNAFTALASNQRLEDQGSTASFDNSIDEDKIELGGYSLEDASNVIEASDGAVVIEENKKDTQEKSEIQQDELEQKENQTVPKEQSNQETNPSVPENQMQAPNEQETEVPLQDMLIGPKAVVSLKYEALSYNQAMLTWEPSEGASNYMIYRSTDINGIYEKVGESTSTSFQSEVECGRVYYYKVISYSGTVEGEDTLLTIVTQPEKISKLKATLNITKVTLSWKKAKGAQSYSIYRSEEKSSGYEKIGEVDNTNYTDKSTAQGKTYYYMICAQSYESQAQGVRLKKGIKIPTGPKAVTKLKYKKVNYNTITLNWKASKGATKYIIYRADSIDGTYKKIKTTKDLSYSQKKLKCGKIYYYKIVPYKDKLMGKEKIIKAYTIPDKVTKLKAKVSDNSITLNWKKAKGATTYEIYRSTSKNSGFTKIAEVGKTKYTDNNLTYGETYYYRVYAVGNGTKGKKVSCYATIPKQNTVNIDGEMRAVWISYLDFATLKDKSKGEFTRNINAMYDKVLAQNANTVIVHVRAFSDAIYPSNYYRWANFITSSDEGPDYDPLSIMVCEAHKKGLSFQAWINPYRSADGGRVNPASTSAIKKIVAGVEEIVANYDVDGIHFDDYFYLSTDQTSQEDKMINVNKLIAQVYAKIKSINSNVVFGISPAGNIDYAKSIGCDVDTWLSSTGYIDYICPQLYWSDDYITRSGSSTKMFSNTMKQWRQINQNHTTMYAGLALYKVGNALETTWGSDMGWGNSTSNLYNQYKAAKSNGYTGYSLYRYESIDLPAAREELKNLRKLSQ